MRPQPTRKAKEATKKKKATSKDDDEYESDFIDGGEDGWEPIDDSDNDADWAPQQGSQEEEEEDDTQELTVNANKRKKKVYDDESEVESIVADNIDAYSSP